MNSCIVAFAEEQRNSIPLEGNLSAIFGGTEQTSTQS
jgi:hypothetical protein